MQPDGDDWTAPPEVMASPRASHSSPQLIGCRSKEQCDEAAEPPSPKAVSEPDVRAFWSPASPSSMSQGSTIHRRQILPHLGPTLGHAVSSRIQELVRTISESTPGGAQRAFRCVICLDEHAVAVKTSFRECSASQTHAMCRACAQTYLMGLIEEGRVKELRCPLYGVDHCEAFATKLDLQDLLTADGLAKYQRFLARAEDPTLRECPLCSEMVKPQSVGDVIKAEMTCALGHQFCFYHSNAHLPGECEAYERLQTEERARALVAVNAKPCPACGILTQRNEGCTHMCCPGCKANWCWICGQKMSNTGWHYNPINPAGCMQFGSVESERWRSPLTCVVRIIAFPGVLLGFIIFWGTLPLWPFCGLGALLALCLVIIVNCLWLPLGCIGALCVWPCGANEDHVQLIIGAPWTACWSSVECVCPCLHADDDEISHQPDSTSA